MLRRQIKCVEGHMWHSPNPNHMKAGWAGLSGLLKSKSNVPDRESLLCSAPRHHPHLCSMQVYRDDALRWFASDTALLCSGGL